MTTVPSAWYLTLAAVVFSIGAFGLLVRRNVLVMFMCVELMLNAANLTFVTFSRMLNDIGGQALVFFTLVVAAAEGGGGLRGRHLPSPSGRHRRRLPHHAGLSAAAYPPAAETTRDPRPPCSMPR